MVHDDAMARWRAPGRVNLIGEHTDYNGGYVLPLAIPQGVTAVVERRDDATLSITSAQAPGATVLVKVETLEPGTVTGWAAYVAGVVWALREQGHPVGGADIHVDGDVPAGSGLSSSAALECSVAAALAEAYELSLAPTELVQVAVRAENAFVGVPTGVMDQSASVLATAGHVLFLDARSLETRQVPFDLDVHGLALLVIDTRTPHALVDGEYAARRRSCTEAAAALGVELLRDIPADGLEKRLARIGDETVRRRARHVVSENARVLETVDLLLAGDVRSVGPLLTESHVSMRDDFEITAPQVDLAQETALATGAEGARMTGGGFGGCVIALVDSAGPAGPDAVSAAVRDAFAGAGFGPPATFVVAPSAGVHPLPLST